MTMIKSCDGEEDGKREADDERIWRGEEIKSIIRMKESARIIKLQNV